MGIGAGTAALITAAIGAGTSIYTSNKQREAQDEANKKTEYAQQEAEREQERIFDATKPSEEGAKITFGTEDDDEMGTYNDFLAEKPKSKPTVGGATTSGLGFGTIGGAS